MEKLPGNSVVAMFSDHSSDGELAMGVEWTASKTHKEIRDTTKMGL